MLNGTAKVEQRGGSKVVRSARPPRPRARRQGRGRGPVRRARPREDGQDLRHPRRVRQRAAPDYPDQDTDPDTPGPARFDGPLHNQIPAPDRSKDNRTVWQADYTAAHYQQLYFGTGERESLKTYYERQSSGRYSVDGQVTDWVKVRYNEARYGRSNGFPCAGNVCSNTWDLIQRRHQHVGRRPAGAPGRTDAQIAAELASYDQWDRNDFDGDGDFNEPDGYIDHFQIVHAGGDQADGDP